MALSVQIFPANGGLTGTPPNASLTSPGNAIANQPAQLLIIIVNGASDPARTINSITVSEITESECQISQPVFLSAAAPGVGNPVILPGATSFFTCSVVFQSPNMPGPSPGNQPGGAAPGNKAQEADAYFTLQVQVASADGQLVTANITIPVLTAVAPAPSLQGGALQLNNPLNLANFIAAFA